MFNTSVIKKTGQIWKGAASAALVIGGFLVMMVGLLTLSSGRPSVTFGLAIAGIMLGAAGFIFACASVRCPKCGARWLWLAIRYQPAGLWLLWVMNQQRCPTCNYS